MTFAHIVLPLGKAHRHSALATTKRYDSQQRCPGDTRIDRGAALARHGDTVTV